MRRGHTLLELATALLLLALLASMAVPSARRMRDRASVVAAREAVAGLVAEARAAARAHGGARVRVDDRPWRISYTVDGEVLRSVELERDLEIASEPAGPGVELRFDALGLGQVASRTLRFRRGDQEAGLVISSYGRLRRW